MIEDYAIVQRFLRDDLINTKTDFTGHVCIYRFAGKASSFPECRVGGGRCCIFQSALFFTGPLPAVLAGAVEGA